MTDPLFIAFVSEAQRHLARVETALRGMDRQIGMANAVAINDCYRGMHTIAGLAGHLALTRIHILAQSAERLLEEMRLDCRHRGAARIDALIRAVARLVHLIDLLPHDAAPAGDDQEIIRELRTWITRPVGAVMPRRLMRDDHSVPRFSQYGNQIPSGPPRRRATTMVGHS